MLTESVLILHELSEPVMLKRSILRYSCCACSLTFRRNCVGNNRILKIMGIDIPIICFSPDPRSPSPVAVAGSPRAAAVPPTAVQNLRAVIVPIPENLLNLTCALG